MEIFKAIKAGNLKKVKLIPESHINIINNKGETPLLLAIKNERVRIVDWLISKGANPNYRDYMDRSCLIWAIKFESKNRYLILWIL